MKMCKSWPVMTTRVCRTRRAEARGSGCKPCGRREGEALGFDAVSEHGDEDGEGVWSGVLLIEKPWMMVFEVKGFGWWWWVW